MDGSSSTFTASWQRGVSFVCCSKKGSLNWFSGPDGIYKGILVISSEDD